MSADADFDVVIVGGAAIGSAVAYFLKGVERFSGSVAVLERDPTFRTASTALSAASIRQQFSTPENIRLSRFGLGFLQGLKQRHGPDADPSLHEGGYLLLAADGGRLILERNQRIQRTEGAAVALLDRNALAARFSWLRTEGIDAGGLGLSGEGWFDAHALLSVFRSGARRAGAEMIAGEAIAIEARSARIAAVRLADGTRIGCRFLVNAAGPSAGRLAALIGRDLPVEPRKRTVFVIDAPDARTAMAGEMPLIADPSGIWMRPEGSGFIAGYSPPEQEDSPADPADFEPDHAIFEEILWPLLAGRIPAFERLKVISAWAGHYDYNTLDQNAVIGPDPNFANFLYANGFSGHGLQHAPGVGRAVAELIVHGGYRTLDLSVFGYDRITAGRPLFEQNVI